VQTLANLSRQKSDKLRAVEDGLCQLQAKDLQIDEKTYQIVGLPRKLDAIKLERTQEVWLLKKEIENLSEKNKSLAKTHRGNCYPNCFAQFDVVE
jgi:hypothetical protein